MKIKLACKDNRGEIYTIKYKNIGFNILFTKKDYMRSGDIHNKNNQYDFVLDGIMDIKVLGGKYKSYKKGQSLIIPKGKPHIFKCKKDCIMLEFWDISPDNIDKEDNSYYLKYRNVVNKTNKAIAQR